MSGAHRLTDLKVWRERELHRINFLYYVIYDTHTVPVQSPGHLDSKYVSPFFHESIRNHTHLRAEVMKRSNLDFQHDHNDKNALIKLFCRY